jgi:hypothetical protein
MKTDSCRWNTVNVIFLFLLAFMIGPGTTAHGREKDASANCDIQSGACVQALGEGSVTLEILPRPVTAMTDLTFRVRLENLNPGGAPGIDLGMPGMNMGPNHVSLEKTTAGDYAGTGVIVRCPSGRTLWQADVTVPGAGAAVFIFDVVY